MRRATQAVLDTEHLVKARTHISIRRPTNDEFKRSGVTEEEFDDLIASEQMVRLTEVFGEAHIPSSNMLLHIAANRVETGSVVPEMFKFAEEIHENDTVKNSVCDGKDSVGQMLYRWNYHDIDVPWQLIKEELNANKRREIKRSRLMLDPDCLFRQCWDVAQVVLLVYMAFQLPYRVGFSIPDPVLWSLDFWIGAAADLYFLLDIYMSFVTCLKDEEGMLSTDLRIMFASYVEGWFLIDLISVMPVQYLQYYLTTITNIGASTLSTVRGTDVQTNATVALANAERMDMQILQVLKLARLVKLLRLARLQRLMKKYETQFYEGFQKIKRWSLFIMIATVSHWLACIWNFVGTSVDEAGHPNGWVVDYVETRYQGPNGTTATLADIPDDQLYLVNYFSAIATLISGTTPTSLTMGMSAHASSLETLVGVFAVVAGGFMYGQIVGTVTELSRKRNMASDVNDMLDARARALCRNANVDVSLRAKVMEQVRYSIDNSPDGSAVAGGGGGGFVEPFLASLTGELEVEFAQQLGWVPKIAHGMPSFGMLHKVPFFTSLDFRSKILICAKMRIVSYDPYDVTAHRTSNQDEDKIFITTEGRPCSDMYIVLEGKVAVVERHKPMGFIEQHMFLSERSILQPQRVSSFGQLSRRTHYAVDKPAKLAVLGYEDFQELRRSRSEINDAVMPYILELANDRATKRSDWFFVEIRAAKGIEAKNMGSLAAKGLSDAYCCLFIVYPENGTGNDGANRNGDSGTDELPQFSSVRDPFEESPDAKSARPTDRPLTPQGTERELLIGSTHVIKNSIDPEWNRTILLTREEVAENGGNLELRFEVYHHSTFGEPEFLGQVTTELSAMVAEENFMDWQPRAQDVKTEFRLMTKDGSSAMQGELQVVISNRDPRSVHSHLDPAIVEDVERRRECHRIL